MNDRRTPPDGSSETDPADDTGVESHRFAQRAEFGEELGEELADLDETIHESSRTLRDLLSEETHSCNDESPSIRESDPEATLPPTILPDPLAGKSWATCGPAIGRRHMTPRVIERLARSTGLTVSDVIATWDFRRYVMLEKLSETSHAMVFAGIDVVLAREVVIKIHKDLRVHAMQQAIRESQIMAGLEHPNIVEIYDVGEYGQWMYFVAERCEMNFQQWYPGKERLDVLARLLEVAYGLVQLHALGFAHGDIKLTNIVVRKGRAKLTDFGHAARVVFSSDDREPGVLVGGGTAGFMAPEVRWEGPGFAADVYALAITIYICLIGKRPFPLPRVTSDEVGVVQVGGGEIERPAKIPAGVPKALFRLLERSMDPDPTKRPSLEALIQGLRSAVEQIEKRKRRRRWLPAVAGAVLAVLAVGVGIGKTMNSGRGSASMSAAATEAFDGPLARAEAAAWRGDVDAAIGALYRMDSDIADLSAQDGIRAAESAERVAKILEQRGHTADAIRAWFFVVQFHEHAGQMQQAESARKAREKLITQDSSQSK